MSCLRSTLPILSFLLLAPGAASAQQPAPPDASARRDDGGRPRPGGAGPRLDHNRAESRAGNPREAQRRNVDAMTPVLDKLRAAGIPADAIRTVGYDLQQEWDFVKNQRVSRGYVARNTIDVRVDAIDRVGELLEIAVGSGATSVGGIRFDLKDRAKLEREALRLAVVEARADADAAAAAAGLAIARVLRIDAQRNQGGPVPMPRVAMMREQANSEAPPISAGQMEIRAQVTLTSILK